MSAVIHPTAVVHAASRLGPNVSIGPYAVIEEGVELGEGTVIASHAIVRSGSILGPGCFIDSHAVVGGLPQDLRFDPRTLSGVRLGAKVVVREGATIHRPTREGAFTVIGEGAFLMANAHVGHDSQVGAHVIIANNVMLGGFVQIGDHAFLGGGAAFHQHVRVGESAMVGGLSRCPQDVPPFTMVAERSELAGLNLIGLKRRGFSRESIRAIKQAFAKLFHESGNLRIRATDLLASPLAENEEARRFLAFFTENSRGFARPLRSRNHTSESVESV